MVDQTTSNQIAAIQTRQRLLGRFSGMEFFIGQAWAINLNAILARLIGISQPLESMLLVWRGRVVIATGNMTVIAAEAPQTILTRVLLTGNGRFGQQTLMDMSGATLHAWMRLFQFRGNSVYINGTRQAEGSVPFAQTLANFGNIGTYDLEIHYRIPFAPMVGPQGRLNQMNYMLRAQDWANGLTLQLFSGDGSSFGTVGTAVFTFTAFGGATGTPSVWVYVNTAILGPERDTYPSAVVLRAETTTPAANVAAVSNAVLLKALARVRTTNVVIKQGTSLAASPANVFAALQDTLLGNMLLNVDQQSLRNWQDWWAEKEYIGQMFSTILPQGYLPVSFIESGNLNAMLQQVIPASSTFSLFANVLSVIANAQVNIIQEQVIGDPQTRQPGQ